MVVKWLILNLSTNNGFFMIWDLRVWVWSIVRYQKIILERWFPSIFCCLGTHWSQLLGSCALNCIRFSEWLTNSHSLSWLSCFVKGSVFTTQRAKSRGFRGESPGILVVGGGNPRRNLGCKWNENPRGNSGEIFLSKLRMRGKVPLTCKHFNSPKNDIQSSFGYFHRTVILNMSLNCFLKFFRETRGGGNFHDEISPGIPQGKEAEIST